MKKNIIYIIPFLFLIACAANLPKNQTDWVPDMEELAAFSNSHSKQEYVEELLRIKNMIDATAYGEICGIYEDSLNEWVTTQEELKIDRADISPGMRC